MQPAMSAVVAFAGQSIWLVGRVSLPFILKDYRGQMQKNILTEFILISELSPYNMLLGGTGLLKLQELPSTMHGVLKFPSDEGIMIFQTTIMGPLEPIHVIQPIIVETINEEESASVNTEGVVINDNYKDQKIEIGAELPMGLQEGLIVLLKKYKDVFSWKPEDPVEIPRSLIEHRLNINPGHTPIVSKKCIMTKIRMRR